MSDYSFIRQCIKLFIILEEKMQKALQKVFSLFIKTNPPRKGGLRKNRAQSLVEVAIAFPILIVLFSGVVEFGFIINYYLSLLDATREAARVYSTGDPYCNVISASCAAANGSDDSNFYNQAALTVQKALDPSVEKPTYVGRRIPLDPAVDDVIVTVYSAAGNTITSHPSGGPYHLFSNGKYSSIFNTTDILNTRVSGAPNAGMLLVEVHYNYHQVLALPWMTAFLPNPLPLRAYTIMPIRAGEP
jgi:Flp pilus assembly protein TadG